MGAINIKLLLTFARVAELRSFTRAAEELGRTPSAISMQISELEGQLDLKLLKRTTRSVEPTPDGAVLLARVQDSLKGLDVAISEVQKASDRRRGKVIFACAPTVVASRLSGILTLYRRAMPRMSINIREMISADLLNAVREREVDFGISPRAPLGADLKFGSFVREPFYALMSREHFSDVKSPLTLKELCALPLLVMEGMPIIALRQGNETATELLTLLQTSGLTPNIVCQVRQAYTLVVLANSGLGVSVIPALAVPENLPNTMRLIRLCDPEIVRDVGIYTLKGEVLSPSAQRLADIFHQDLGDYARRLNAQLEDGFNR